MRKINLALATLALLLPGYSFALGLGDIEVNSALNQPLNAEITLVSVADDELEDIEVKLASEDAFKKANIDRPFYLNDLRFKPVINSSGLPVVQVSTRGVVREPFLNFLVEVRWAKGRLLREYTILLDPPVYFDRDNQAQAVTQPAEAVSDEALPGEAVPSEIELMPLIDEPVPESEMAVEPSASLETAPEPTLDSEPEVVAEVEPVEPEPVAELDADTAIEPVAELTPDASSDYDPFAEPLVDLDENGNPIFTEPEAVEAEVFAEVGPAPEGSPSFVFEPDLSALEVDGESVEVVDSAPVSGGLAFSDAEYKVQKGDSLMRLSEQMLEGDALSVNQMMVAMLRANPNAFVNNNINRLKAGVVLRIPTEEEIQAVNSREAFAEVKAQNTLWQEYKTQLAGNKVPQTAVPESVEGLETAEVQAADEVAAQPSGQLEIVSSEGAEIADEQIVLAGGDSVKALQGQLNQTRESLQSRARENEELQSRVKELEAMLEKQGRLIQLKNEQLNDLQTQADGEALPTEIEPNVDPAIEIDMNGAEGGSTSTPAIPSEGATDVDSSVEELVEPEVVIAETEQGETEPDFTESSEAVVDAEIMPESEMPLDKAEASDEAIEEPPVVPQPKFIPPPNQPKGLLEGDNFFVFAGAGLAVLGMLVFLIMRLLRKKKAPNNSAVVEDFHQDSIIDDVPPMPDEMPDDVPSFNEEASLGDAPLISEPEATIGMASPEPAEPAEPAEPEEDEDIVSDDTIAEVDVYLAYGLYPQAEELLVSSLQEDPKRNDYRVKLLECYHSSGEKDKFDATLAELNEKLAGRKGMLWQRAVAMAKEVSPDNPLISGEDVSISVDDFSAKKLDESEIDLTAENTGGDDDLVDLDFGADEIGAESPDEEAADFDSTMVAEPPLDDIDETMGATQIMETDDIEKLDTLSGLIDEAADDSMDFSLDALADEDIAEVVAESDSFATSDLEFKTDDLDFDADDIDLDSLVDDAESLDLGGTDDSADADVNDLLSSLEEDSSSSDLDLSANDDLDNLSFDMDESESDTDDGLDMSFDTSNMDQPSPGELDLDDGLLSDEGDEVGTKLDLAKAYIDMGDDDGARSTLEEVVAEGNASQRSEAEQLLQNMA